MTAKNVKTMSDAELAKEVTELRDLERTGRKARKPVAKSVMRRITDIALEQGDRWARAQGWE